MRSWNSLKSQAMPQKRDLHSPSCLTLISAPPFSYPQASTFLQCCLCRNWKSHKRMFSIYRRDSWLATVFFSLWCGCHSMENKSSWLPQTYMLGQFYCKFMLPFSKKMGGFCQISCGGSVARGCSSTGMELKPPQSFPMGTILPGIFK